MRMIANRYNSEWVMGVLTVITNKATYFARWQVSFTDNRGRCYDHFFAAKPTRKQIRKLRKDIKKC